MSEAMIRVFVGLALPRHVCASLMEMQDLFRKGGIRGAWTPEDNFHVTLRFLGNITYPQIEALDVSLSASLSEFSSLHCRFSGAGVFPNAKRPSVVWAGLRVLNGELAAIYEAVCASAGPIGLEEEQRLYHPHVTLLRLRRGHAPRVRLEDCIEEAGAVASDDFWIDSVALWRSELRRGGAVYHKLKEYPLQCLPSNC